MDRTSKFSLLLGFAGVDPQTAFSELVLVALVSDGKLFRLLRFGEEDDIGAAFLLAAFL